ncbi:MAG: hypothetical protein A2Z20_01325 [Bdellovibrionales bacterium RBG_16_40_8]|nr:MAG: hypothetical protein A2Z20_01325 [Bdellovibrionales bacterium RBG_16_40_8]
MDYSFFDGLLDSVFVIDDNRRIVYCNDTAAWLCESSVRRLTKGKGVPIYELIKFSNNNLFAMPGGEIGKDEVSPYIELDYQLVQAASTKCGKIQVAIQPFLDTSREKRWVVMVRDVTLEEVLHAKYQKQLEEKEEYIQQLQDAQRQLEQYSKNLEQMVEERTQEVKRANLMLNAIVNSLGQGFFVFDQAGTCLDFYTRACKDVLEIIPAQKHVWDVLKVPANELDTFHLWLKAVYSELLPFDSIKELGPSQFKHSQEKHVTLEYYPLRSDNKKISNVVVVATDKTVEYFANKALEKEKKFAKMVVKIVAGKKQFTRFLHNAKSVSADIRESIDSQKDSIDYEYIFRALHTLEGEAAAFSANEIWTATRSAQEILEPIRHGEAVDIKKIKNYIIESLQDLDAIYRNFVKANSELFLTMGIGSSDKIEIQVSNVETILRKLEQKGINQPVRNYIEDALLRESVESSFRYYQDIVDMIAAKLGKNILPIEFHGLGVRVHLAQYQALFSTLVHAYRNAVDHGIESSAERKKMSKPTQGLIQTYIETFERMGAWLRIKIIDDGRGISIDALRKKLVAAGEAEKIKDLSEAAIMQHVFSSGISSKDEVGEFSGRGIGMNAIREEAERLGGKAWVESEKGKGTQLIIEVPDLQRAKCDNRAA